MSDCIGLDTKVVLFDHDDTLVATLGPKGRQHKYVARNYYGKDLTDEQLRTHWGKPLSTLLGLLYDTDDIETALARNRAEYANFPKELHPHTVPALDYIQNSGRKIGIVTATRRPNLEADLAHLGIPEARFDYLQTEESTPFHKPDPRVFEPAVKWLGGLGIRPGEAVYIGDGLQDMEAALGIGFQFVGVGTGLITPGEFRSRGAKAVNHLGELFHHRMACAADV
jgi:phosphoglycolate phosphatase-like HAD superfamily hydrolase